MIFTNRALEDGATLGALLGRIESKLQIPIAAELYETIRKARIFKIREETFKQQAEFHLPDGVFQEDRDRLLAMSFEPRSEDEPW